MAHSQAEHLRRIADDLDALSSKTLYPANIATTAGDYLYEAMEAGVFNSQPAPELLDPSKQIADLRAEIRHEQANYPVGSSYCGRVGSFMYAVDFFRREGDEPNEGMQITCRTLAKLIRQHAERIDGGGTPPTVERAPDDQAARQMLSVLTNGLANERFEQVESVLQDSALSVSDKLEKINAAIPIPPSASAEELGKVFGVSKQAVLKTEWWNEHRKGQKADSQWCKAEELAGQCHWLNARNRGGENIYVGPNPRKREGGTKTADVAFAWCLFADWDGIDVDAARQRWEKAGLPEPTLIIQSGHGVHAYWRLDALLTNLSEWTELQKALIVAVRSDPSIHDPPRIMRLPGFQNCKSEPRVPCGIVAADPARRYSMDRLRRVLAPHITTGSAKPVTSPQPERSTAIDDSTIERAKKYVAKTPGAVSGQHGHDATFHVACLLVLGFGLPPAVAYPVFADWNTTCNPPWEERDLRRKLDEADKQSGPRGYLLTPDRHRTANIEPFRPFPIDALPGIIGRYTVEAATAIGCEASYVALPLIACVARAIGGRRVIRLKPDWREPPIVWGVIVGESGTQKTPALSAATKILERKQSEAFEQHAKATRQFEYDMTQYESKLYEWKKQPSEHRGEPPTKPIEHVLDRFIVSDVTVEGLADRLDHPSGDGLLLVRDELSGWLGSFDAYRGGKGGDSGHWLSMWSGKPLIIDRKTGPKKTIYIDRAAVSIAGGIQPETLRRALGREHYEDGMAARLLLAMPDRQVVLWSDAEIPKESQTQLANLFDKLLAIEAARDERDRPAPKEIGLSEEAKAEWIQFFNRHRGEQAELSGDLAAAWSKLEAYAARLALIIHLCRWAEDASVNPAWIDNNSLRAAVRLTDWFGNEARRVYALLAKADANDDDLRTHELIRRNGGRITVRELQQADRRFRNSAVAAEAELDRLASAGQGRWEPLPTSSKGGRPTRHFVLAETSPTDGSPVKSKSTEGSVDVDKPTAAEPAGQHDEVSGGEPDQRSLQ